MLFNCISAFFSGIDFFWRTACLIVFLRFFLELIFFGVPRVVSHERRKRSLRYFEKIDERKRLYEDVYQDVLDSCEGGAGAGADAAQRNVQRMKLLLQEAETVSK
jgi:hypothetical protein